ncbi:MAG: NAD-dependent epimerase/dehydratase family protein [Cyanobacteria bacterium P01_D01_bin.105]
MSNNENRPSKKVFITGAAGFVGQYVVAAVLRAGHQVLANVRAKAQVENISWHDHPNVTFIRQDLRQRRGLIEAVATADAVIHLAAVKSGDFYDQFAGTVIATENLLWAMKSASIKQLVAISTFSVYDFVRIKPGQLLDENGLIEATPKNRDEYAQTKLIQEQLYRAFEGDVTILRPGMIYGRNNLWHALIGAEIGGNRWLKIGGSATLPMAYVENCAEAIAAALTAPAAVGQTINIVDDNLPTQKAYLKLLLAYTPAPPKLIPVSWLVMRSIANLAWWYNQKILGGQAKLPGILVPAKLQGRFKPLKYNNQRAKDLLDWVPQHGLGTAFERSCSDLDLVAVPFENAQAEISDISAGSEGVPVSAGC